MKELLQIFFTYCFRIVSRVLFIFPINKKRITFISFGGRSFSCSPKYIYKELEKKYVTDLQYVWLFKNTKEHNLDDFNSNTVLVKYPSLKAFYFLATSKIIITNYSMIIRPPVRKKQIYLNTWHGGGAYKKVGVTNITKDKKRTDITFDLLAKDTTYMISSCKRFSINYVSTMRLNKEKFLEIGMPRNDIFFNNTNGIKDKVKKHFNIPSNKKVLLFAPTFRGGDRTSRSDFIDIDIEKVVSALNERFEADFVCLYRGHYYVNKKTAVSNTIDSSKYEDMQELLCTADVLITDYSSSIWDFSFTKKPCFLFTSDLKEYAVNREFYTPINMWGFPYAEDNTELVEKILNFDEKKYLCDLEKMHEYFGSFENGSACSKIIELLKL